MLLKINFNEIEDFRVQTWELQHSIAYIRVNTGDIAEELYSICILAEIVSIKNDRAVA